MLAVTTTQDFYFLDEDDGSLWKIDEGNGVYYGISFSDDCLYLATRQAAYGKDRTGQRNIILCYDKKLEIIEALSPEMPLRDVHQIAFDEGCLYVCSTFDDRIGCYNLQLKEWQFWAPFGPEQDLGCDKHHINSITLTADEVLMAGLHPTGWVARFDKKTRRLTQEKQWLGSQTHNVWLEKSKLYICSSLEGGVRSESGDFIKIAERSWVRGYCEKNGDRYLGLCETRFRKDRPSSNCCIVQCAPDFRIKRSFWIPQSGMVHDLRSIDTPDPSHNKKIFSFDRDILDKKFIRIYLENTLGSFTQE